MKARINFEYDGKPYQFTIDSEKIDLDHYEEIWDAWFNSEDNELEHDVITNDDNFDFEINGEKAFFPRGCELIGIETLEVFVYKADEDNYVDRLEEYEIKVTILEEYEEIKSIKIGAKAIWHDVAGEVEDEEYEIGMVGDFETNEELEKFQSEGNRIDSETIILLCCGAGETEAYPCELTIVEE